MSAIRPKRHGFRISILDGLILAVGLALTLWLRALEHPLWWMVAVVVGHFFLFCNVFLVWRKWELLWAGAFVLNVAAHLALEEVGWASVLAWQLPVTVLVIGLQLRSPWYHGVLAERMNPRLKDYLNDTL